ncbi:MAG: lysophospholipid acyltransferase family protein, partial [Bacillota bacterium]|nr:lysophospholipid acyltransferase family protein [Bacillota bacterium]
IRKEASVPLSPSVALLYRFLHRIARPIIRLLFRCRIEPNREAAEYRGPLLVLANHVGFADPVFVALSLPSRRPVRFVVGAHLYTKPVAGYLLRLIKVIPKLQFVRDSTAVRQILTGLREDNIIGIFPEGQRSVDGRSLPIDGAITKLVQRTGAALLTLRIDGACLAWPRWRGMRPTPGRIALRSRFYEPEKVAAMKPDALHRLILDDLKGNDYDWADSVGRPRYLGGRSTRGLADLLHRCPNCEHDFVMRQEGRHALRCSYCGATSELRRTGFFAPGAPFPHPAAWHLWQIEAARQERASGAVRKLRATCQQIGNESDPYAASGPLLDGTLVLEQRRLVFIPDHSDQEAQETQETLETQETQEPAPDAFYWALSAAPEYYFMDLGIYVDLYTNGTRHRICPLTPQAVSMINDWAEAGLLEEAMESQAAG